MGGVSFQNEKKIAAHYSDTYLFYWELVADCLLICGIGIFSFIFWDKTIMALLARGAVHSVGDVFFRFFFLLVAFVLFYMPLRYLFLIEDHTTNQTWKRLLFIFGFLLVRYLLALLS